MTEQFQATLENGYRSRYVLPKHVAQCRHPHQSRPPSTISLQISSKEDLLADLRQGSSVVSQSSLGSVEAVGLSLGHLAQLLSYLRAQLALPLPVDASERVVFPMLVSLCGGDVDHTWPLSCPQAGV